MQASATLTQPTRPPQSFRGLAWGVLAERLLLLLLLLIFAVRGLVPGWRHLNSHFASYYLAARLYRDARPEICFEGALSFFGFNSFALFSGLGLFSSGDIR